MSGATTGWTYHNPVRLRFGEGAADCVGEALAGRPYVLVTYPDAPLLPWRAHIVAQCGAPLTVIEDIEPNPSLEMLRRVAARMPQVAPAPGAIVALGGGSVLDTAKFLALGHGSYDVVLRYLESGEPPARPALPIIAVPTTAGTGSDLTKWATIWDPARGQKLSLEHDSLYAETALVDPRIMASLPWDVTLASGLDALSHALESIWNRNANPVTRDFAVRAALDLMAALPRLQEDPGDKAARTRMALGAARAGLAFSNTRTALAHSISYPVTLDHGVAHGIACSFCLPEVLAAAIGLDADCDAALAAIFGALATAPERLRALLSGLGVPAAPGDLGIYATEWRHIVEQAFVGPRGRNFIGTAAQFG